MFLLLVGPIREIMLPHDRVSCKRGVVCPHHPCMVNYIWIDIFTINHQYPMHSHAIDLFTHAAMPVSICGIHGVKK
jgi:hypothetical protein